MPGTENKNVQKLSAAHPVSCSIGRLRLKCDGTRAETTFGFSAKWTNPFKSAGFSSVD